MDWRQPQINRVAFVRGSTASRAVDEHARGRLRQWLCGKHQADGRGLPRFSDVYLHLTLGLPRLSVRARNLPSAKA